jgi:ribosomal protein S18 acetylase RimI-like enzyme
MSEPDARFHIQANFEFLLEAMGRKLPKDATRTDQGSVRCLSGLPHPLGNLVIERQQNLPEFMGLLQELETWCSKAHVPVSVLLFPFDGLETCISEAGKRKWIYILSLPGMWMAMEDETNCEPIAPAVEIRLVKSPEDLDLVCGVLAEGYPIPDKLADLFMRGIQEYGDGPDKEAVNFLLTVKGAPAACASVCVKDGVAGIYCVATLERFRRQGLGGQVTRAALRHGWQLGATHALLHATKEGEPVYRRIGFTEACRIHVISFGM